MSATAPTPALPSPTRALFTSALGYALIAMAVLLAFLWLDSHTVRLTYAMPLTTLPGGWQLFLDEGTAYFIEPHTPYAAFHFPLWPFILGFAAAGVWLCGSRRRLWRARCHACGGCPRCWRLAGAKRRVAGAAVLFAGFATTAAWVCSGWWIASLTAGGSTYWIGGGTVIGCTNGNPSTFDLTGAFNSSPNPGGLSWHILKESPATPPKLLPSISSQQLARYFITTSPTGSFVTTRATPSFPDAKDGATDFNLGLLYYQYGANGYRRGAAVIWPFSLLLFSAGGWLFFTGRRARRRANTGMCVHCGYSFAGIAPDAPCPECGRPRAVV